MPVEAMAIDGSAGEGGGQILRTALAFSAIKGVPITVHNIRANRPRPGLAPQHIAGLRLLAQVCGAEVSGLEAGSGTVSFNPGRIRPGDYCLNIGTAGSVTLAMQAVLPVLASAEGRSTVTISGGTDVKWSPPLDYYGMVLFPLLRRMGLECALSTFSRGYFPEGGGKVALTVVSSGTLGSLELRPLSMLDGIKGIVNVAGLSANIAQRAADSALAALPAALRGKTDIRAEHRDCGHSRGMGIVLAATDGQTILGASCLGERGKPAEKVGKEAAGKLLEELGSGCAVDTYASDQLLPYIAIAGGSYTARELTGHAMTNVGTIRQFLSKGIAVKEGTVVEFSMGK